MMKKTILLSCIFLFSLHGYSQFVALEGRQFFDENHQPFYPVLMNYGVDYAFFIGMDKYVIAPYTKYGPTDGYECNDSVTCSEDIRNDLIKIKSMGFNMIRPCFTPKWDKTINKFIIEGWEFAPNGWNKRHVEMNQPYEDDPTVAKYFRYLDWLADQAYQLGMLTMINGTLGDHTDTSAKAAYLAFLPVLGSHFKNNTKIAFYDILSEPIYNYNGQLTKKEACELVSDFYDALKGADPNHLITGCNIGFEESSFDVGLLKLDFSQPHPYSWPRAYDGYSTVNTINRVKGHLYWISKNCPMPWMEGETGFASSDDIIWPGIGTNAQQKEFADEILTATRNCGSSGFAWWWYQDCHQGDTIDGYGLLPLYCDINVNPNCEKITAEIFKNYLNPLTHQPPDIEPAQCVKPPNYYDPFLHCLYNPTHHNAVSGYLLDINNKPIVDAYIAGVNYRYKTFDPINGLSKYFNSWIYTLTDENGYFEVIPFNDKIAGDDKIICIKGNSVGGEKFERGQTWPPNDIQMQPQNVGTITTKKVDFRYDLILEDETVLSGNSQNYKAWNSITASDFIVQTAANSALHARQRIRLLSGFSAKSGSAVHILPAETFSDCDDYSGFTTLKNSQILAIGELNTNGNTPENIELQFEIKKSSILDVVILPNPNKGLFTVKLNSEFTDTPLTLKVKSLLGATLAVINTMGNEIQVDMSYLSTGVYMIEISANKHFAFRKFIIQ